MFSPTLFQDQIALVTGGRSGIGFAIAKVLLQSGASVVIASRKADKLALAAEALRQFGTVYAHPCDIRDTEQVAALADFIADGPGRLDLLVNNAGGQFPVAAEALSAKGWNAVINNNLNGTFYVTSEMAKRFMIPQKAGSILNIIVDIFRGFPGMAHTGAARAGIANLTMSLAVEWSKYNIRINCVAPGIIDSTGLEQYPAELKAGLSAKIPMQRFGTVEEVAYAAFFLLSPMAAYTTGDTLYVDGGRRLKGDLFDF
ncbi:MAG: SDR family oxidoreductase [Bacteroidetes bacterium]|nr:MAG: SDR family oxidoreductase [Bacteroidota bacterium]